MQDSLLGRLESSLRQQQDALADLIEIALSAVKESGESSVSAIHLSARLQKLSDSLKPPNPSTPAPQPPLHGR